MNYSSKSEDCTNLSIEDRNRHGEHILDILTSCAPKDSTFAFYKVVELGEWADEGNIIEALSKMVDDDIDIANLSIGVPKKEDEERENLRKAVNGALEQGLILVAAAGNTADIDQEDDELNTVFDPARVNGVLSVGGFLSHCTEDENCDNVSYSFEVAGYTEGPFCGGQEDMISKCEGADTYRCWEGNVDRTVEDPIVYAPVHYPCRRADDLAEEMNVGTSYGTPLVTGQLAEIMCELDIRPSPEHLIEVVKESSEGDQFPKFSALNTQYNMYESFVEKY